MKRPKRVVPYNLFPRASAFYAYSNCAISFRLSQAAGPEPPSEDSLFGTATHGVLSGEVKPDGVEPSVREMALELETQYGTGYNAWSQTLGDAQPESTQSERRLYLKDGAWTLASGQPDRFSRAGHSAHLADFKTSWHPIDALPATNTQLRVYAALLYDHYKHRLEELLAHIHKPGARLPPVLFKRSELKDARSWSIDVAMTALSPTPGAGPRKGPWCRYCSGKVLCPLWQTEIKNLTSFALAEIDSLSDQALANLAPRLELAAQVVTRLQERLYDRVAHSPLRFPGWHIKPGQWKRKITNPIQAYFLLVTQEKLLSHEDFLQATRISISTLKSSLASILGSPTKADQTLNSLLVPLAMDSTQARPQLAYDPALQTCPNSATFLPELSQTQIPSTQPLLSLPPQKNVSS